MGQARVDREYTIEELRDIVTPIAVEYGVPRVYLFGSRARGDNREDSDYDFCITVPKSFGLLRISSFLYDLKDAIGDNVDLVWEDNLRPPLMEEILRDRRLVFEA
jgi:predicted nucleotidyltransferase